MENIGLDQLLINSALYEHICYKLLRSYTNILKILTINRSINPPFKNTWYPILSD